MTAPARCDHCRRTITFVPSEATGTPMPLDDGQHGDGNVVLVQTLLGQRAHVLTKWDHQSGRYDDLPRYMPHFATCPKRRR